jgi:hypothetical protein
MRTAHFRLLQATVRLPVTTKPILHILAVMTQAAAGDISVGTDVLEE